MASLTTPTGVKAELKGTDGVEVTWQASTATSCELDRYEVQQRVVGAAAGSGGDDWAENKAKGKAKKGQLSLSVAGLAAGASYEFRVVAHVKGGVATSESDPSAPLQIPGSRTPSH